jgi:hypothetical protein
MHFASRTGVNTPLSRTVECVEYIAEFLPSVFIKTVTEEEDKEDEGPKQDKFVSI